MRFKKITLFIFFLTLFIVIPKKSNAESPELDFYELFNNHGSMMLLIVPDTGEIQYANISAAQFYGYTIDELVDMNLFDLIVIDESTLGGRIDDAISNRTNYFESKNRLSNGEIRDVSVYSYPIELNDKILIFSIINDITERVALEEAREKQKNTIIIMSIITTFILFASTYVYYRNSKKYRCVQVKY